MGGGRGRGGLTSRTTSNTTRSTGGRFAQLLGTALDGPITAEQQRSLTKHFGRFRNGGESTGANRATPDAPAAPAARALLTQLPLQIAGQPLEMLPLGGCLGGRGRCGRLLVLVVRRLGCAATAHNGGGGLGWLLLQYVGGCVTWNGPTQSAS